MGKKGKASASRSPSLKKSKLQLRRTLTPSDGNPKNSIDDDPLSLEKVEASLLKAFPSGDDSIALIGPTVSSPSPVLSSPEQSAGRWQGLVDSVIESTQRVNSVGSETDSTGSGNIVDSVIEPTQRDSLAGSELGNKNGSMEVRQAQKGMVKIVDSVYQSSAVAIKDKNQNGNCNSETIRERTTCLVGDNIFAGKQDANCKAKAEFSKSRLVGDKQTDIGKIYMGDKNNSGLSVGFRSDVAIVATDLQVHIPVIQQADGQFQSCLAGQSAMTGTVPVPCLVGDDTHGVGPNVDKMY